MAERLDIARINECGDGKEKNIKITQKHRNRMKYGTICTLFTREALIWQNLFEKIARAVFPNLKKNMIYAFKKFGN